jgi:hypothetical protein
MRKVMRAQVRRGSQVHQMPQMMRAQIMPVTRPMTVKTRPTSMSETARESLLKFFFQMALALATNLECGLFWCCGKGSPCQCLGKCNFATRTC